MNYKEINQNLLNLCTTENPDYAEIEKLLKNGAEPMELVYAELGESYLYTAVIDYWLDISQFKREKVPEFTEITRLFLKYGMDIDNPKYGYDGDGKSNPMWDLGFYGGEDFLRSYKIILEHGLSAENADACWSHDYGDHYLSDYDDSDFERIMLKDMAFKMLIALSYPLSRNKRLEGFLHASHNSYDVSKFKDWENYTIDIDASKRENKRINGTIITVFEKESGNKVWQFVM